MDWKKLFGHSIGAKYLSTPICATTLQKSNPASTSDNSSESRTAAQPCTANVDAPFRGEVAAPVSVWTPEQQKKFHADLFRLVIAANTAYLAVDHPYRSYFFSTWVPGSQLLSWQSLTGPILKAESEKVMEDIKAEVSGKYRIRQCDG